MKYIAVITCFFLNSLNLFACSCVGFHSIEEELFHSSSVFIGQVISIEEPVKAITKEDSISTPIDSLPFRISVHVSMEMLPYKIVTFKVKELFKGGASKIITLKTGSWSTNCGVNFEKNKQYLVYADWQHQADFGQEPYLYTSSCHRTKPLEDADQERAILRSVKKND